MAPHYSASTDYLCLEARGADAGAFLQAQLSQALDTLPPERAPLAGWHDARGRVRALLRAVRLPERWLLLTARDGAEQLLQRLRVFVLRSAVTLAVATDVEIAAVLGAEATWLERHALAGNATPGTCRARGQLHWLYIGGDYWQVLGPKASLDALTAPLAAAPAGAAALEEIRLGLPLVTASVADRFVAQMLNLELLGAVSFDKGCYPGQEVVARVHHRGDVKRRLRRYAVAAPPPAIGTPVHGAGGVTVGEVLRSAPAAAGAELLAVVDDVAAGMPLASAGAALRELPLPYAVARA